MAPEIIPSSGYRLADCESAISEQSTRAVSMTELVLRVFLQSDPNLKAKDFPNALRKFAKSRMDPNDPEELEELEHLAHIPFRPDAYLLDADTGEAVLYEIEDTNPLTLDKIGALVKFYWILDNIGVSLRLIVLDRYAQAPRELDLLQYSISLDVPSNR